jgi:hypothetical protein
MKWIICLVMLSGCEDLSFAPTDGGVGPVVVSTENADGTTTTRVDSRDNMSWVNFDFESKERVPPTDSKWDVGLQRYKIQVNGGASGSGGVEVALLPGADFDALEKAPSSGWITDAPDSPTDDDEEPDKAFHVGEGWYIYDITVHTLTARDIVYVVKSHEGNYYKVKLKTYYDDAGTPGFPTFRWAKIDPPSGSDVITIDASAPGVWTYVNSKTGVTTSSAAWDLAFSGRDIRTNSGSSGSGLGGAQAAPMGSSWGTLIVSGTVGFVADAGGKNAALDNWTQDAVYLVRTATGEYTKLTVVSWSNGVFGIRWSPLLRQVRVEQMMVDATSTAYVSLRLGKLSPDWDLSFTAEKIRTNGGAASDPMEADLASIVSATMAPFVLDDAGGNSVLDGWHDAGNMPLNKTFIVRLADGGYAKLKIGGYASSVYTLFWSYAGAGRADF